MIGHVVGVSRRSLLRRWSLAVAPFLQRVRRVQQNDTERMTPALFLSPLQQLARTPAPRSHTAVTTNTATMIESGGDEEASDQPTDAAADDGNANADGTRTEAACDFFSPHTNNNHNTTTTAEEQGKQMHSWLQPRRRRPGEFMSIGLERRFTQTLPQPQSRWLRSRTCSCRERRMRKWLESDAKLREQWEM